MKNQSIIIQAKQVLIQLLDCISTLSFDEYTTKIDVLGGSTIGEHTRHIIELFQQLLQGYNTSIIDYDKRKRDVTIQQDIDYAVDIIAEIIGTLEKDNKMLHLLTIYEVQEMTIETNYLRELQYNIEHCKHHQALIKIGFMHFGKEILIQGFGLSSALSRS
jgi:hypothetical protein